MSTATMERPVEVDNDLAPGYLPDKTIDDDKRAWCAATLADLPTSVTFRDVPVQNGRDKKGMGFRRAFGITVTPGYRFNIHIHAGATPDDLKHAEDLIERAKRGWFNSDIWEPTTFKDGRTGWVLKCYWQWDGVVDIAEIRPCTMPGCDAEYHVYRGGEFDDAHHSSESVDTEFYRITVSNYEEKEGWRPFIDFFDEIPEGPAGLKVLRDAANDFDWLQQHADMLNAQAAEVSGR